MKVNEGGGPDDEYSWRGFLYLEYKTVWTRSESVVGHHKRHAMWLHHRWGATREGKLIAAEIHIVADGGAYCYTTNKVLGNSFSSCIGPYEIPNIKVDVDGVYTNNPPCAAYRGFGYSEFHFGLESHMTRLADRLGIDAVEFRKKNAIREGDTLPYGAAMNPSGLIEAIDRAAEARRGCRRILQLPIQRRQCGHGILQGLVCRALGGLDP